MICQEQSICRAVAFENAGHDLALNKDDCYAVPARSDYAQKKKLTQ